MRYWSVVCAAALAALTVACDQGIVEPRLDVPFFGVSPMPPAPEGEIVVVCKDGPAGVYKFTVTGPNDVGGAFSLAAGDCIQVTLIGGNGSLVTVTEDLSSLPANVAFDRITIDHVGGGAYPSVSGASASVWVGGNVDNKGPAGAVFVFYNVEKPPVDVCVPGPVGGINLGNLPRYLFIFADGSQDANWQGATKGFAGDAVVDGVLAKERTSGGVPYAGTISTNDGTLGPWQKIVDQNVGQAFASTGQGALVSGLKGQLMAAFAQINGLAVTPGFANRSSTSLNGLNTLNGVPQTTVINVTSGFQVSSKIFITGDPDDTFVLRWDTDSDFSNGYQGQVKFQSGGAIVPQGGLTPGRFIHVAGDINASGGGSNPAAPYPQGPRFDNGLGALINGGKDFSGGGFFTGYWLTTGAPGNGGTASLSNAIFVGGWYTLTNKFSMTSGTSGVHVCPLR